MILASMIRLNKDALICDLAETYHIYDYRSLPVKLAATLSAGLRDDSRIKMFMAEAPITQDTLLLAMIADRIELFRRSFTSKGKDAPVSMVDLLLNRETKQKKGVVGFRTVAEFEAARARIISNIGD